jgi:hypothetical protein
MFVLGLRCCGVLEVKGDAVEVAVVLFSIGRCRIGRLLSGGGWFGKRGASCILSEVFDENQGRMTRGDSCEDLLLNRAIVGIS